MPRPRGRSRRRGTRFSARRASRSDRIRGGDPNGRASRTRPSSVLSSPVTRTAWPAAAPPAARARSSPAGEGPSLPRRAWCATRSSSSRSSWRTPRAARSPMGSCASRARCGARGSRRISPRRFHRRGGSSSIRKPRRSAPRSRALSSDWRSRSRASSSRRPRTPSRSSSKRRASGRRRSSSRARRRGDGSSARAPCASGCPS